MKKYLKTIEDSGFSPAEFYVGFFTLSKTLSCITLNNNAIHAEIHILMKCFVNYIF